MERSDEDLHLWHTHRTTTGAGVVLKTSVWPP